MSAPSLAMDASRDMVWAYKLRSSEGFIVFAVAVAIFVVSLCNRLIDSRLIYDANLLVGYLHLCHGSANCTSGSRRIGRPTSGARYIRNNSP